MITRKEQLLELIKDRSELAVELVEDVIFLEGQLEYLKTLPFIRINPNNFELQKATPAAKQYKELLQQYTNCIKTLVSMSGDDEAAEDSPLREWVRNQNVSKT